MAKKNEKQSAKELAEQLLVNRKNGFFSVSDARVKKADTFCEGYKAFLQNAKTEREAVIAALKIAQDAGFTAYDPAKTYQAGDRVYVNNRGKSLMLTTFGTEGCKNGVRIEAAHIDCPRLDLKPHPLFEQDDLAQLKTHYYGGIKKYQWTTIPLAMHGRICRKDGTTVDISLGEKPGDPLFTISDLLPHLAREQEAKAMSKAIEGEKLNVLVGSRPVRDEEGKNLFKLNTMRLLNEQFGITEEDFVSADIAFVPAYHPCDIGFDRSLVGAYGQDDRSCAYAELMAAVKVKNPAQTNITIFADREEIGSMGNTGMQSHFLYDFVEDLAEAEGTKARYVFAKSRCLSADVTAAFDPNYADVYEANNATYLNNGVGVCKYTGAAGKYDTSDARAEFVSEIRRLFDKNEVLWQIGEMGKIDAGGGGTVAMYIANLNVDVIDVGVPVLSMHSPFEVVSKLDEYMTYQAMKVFFEAE
ncbi:MAG: aminopeptidase [Oscillospiraceae bacterium]|nr:aminopeptidase [Oscillospiraceae bacterium]MDD3261080.1 aminopeptidase [Oscillospiraceae bacterium]